MTKSRVFEGVMTSEEIEIIDSLHQYGIIDEKSDFRIHVWGIARILGIYHTKYARQVALDGLKGKYKRAAAGQYNATGFTGYGIIAPWDAPEASILAEPAPKWFDEAGFLRGRDQFSTSQRGSMAMALVNICAEHHFLPLPRRIAETDITQELLGQDGVIKYGEGIIQVKYDHMGGPKERGGSGRVFFQTHERNPRSLH